MPSRYALVTTFAAAGILALVIDALRMHIPTSSIRGTPAVGIKAAGAVVVAAIRSAPLVPAWPMKSEPAAIPSFFASADARVIPEDLFAVLYPVPRQSFDQAMLWQASAGMRFKQPGGYAVGPTDTGTATFSAYPTDLEQCLNTIYTAGAVLAGYCRSGVLVNEMKQLHVRSVVVPLDQSHAETASRLMENLLGARPEIIGGVDFWPVWSGSGVRRNRYNS